MLMNIYTYHSFDSPRNTSPSPVHEGPFRRFNTIKKLIAQHLAPLPFNLMTLILTEGKENFARDLAIINVQQTKN